MTVTDLRCDVCGTLLAGPAGHQPDRGAGAVRFLFHPGDFRLKDDAGMMCTHCWDETTATLGERLPDRCCRCGQSVERIAALHWHYLGDPEPWLLCRSDAVEVLNSLRTVQPKLGPDDLSLAADWKHR